MRTADEKSSQLVLLVIQFISIARIVVLTTLDTSTHPDQRFKVVDVRGISVCIHPSCWNIWRRGFGEKQNPSTSKIIIDTTHRDSFWGGKGTPNIHPSWRTDPYRSSFSSWTDRWRTHRHLRRFWDWTNLVGFDKIEHVWFVDGHPNVDGDYLCHVGFWKCSNSTEMRRVRRV